MAQSDDHRLNKPEQPKVSQQITVPGIPYTLTVERIEGTELLDGANESISYIWFKGPNRASTELLRQRYISSVDTFDIVAEVLQEEHTEAAAAGLSERACLTHISDRTRTLEQTK
jgi:hypothetical protein